MTAGLTIGVDARAAVEVPAGRGRYVRELLRALARREDEHRYLLYARERWPEPLGDRFAWRRVAAPDPLWHLGAALRANDACDAFLSTNSYLTVWGLLVPTAVVVYDLVGFAAELRPQGRASAIERATLPRAARRASAFLAISEATAGELQRRFPQTRGRVAVTPLGASADVRPREVLPAGRRRGVLAVGTLEPRKNLPRLVEAYRRLPAALQERHPLLVTGEVGWDADPTIAALDGLGERARRLGHVSDQELADLYGSCAVFCYPSLGEGFGLPVLEAMQAGAPVLTSDRSSLPEVGGDAAAYADPTDAGALAGALAALLVDQSRRAELGRRAVERARAFSWDRTAAATLAVLERIARGQPASSRS